MAATQMGSWYALLKKGRNSKPKFKAQDLIAALDLSNENANNVIALKENIIKINLKDLSPGEAKADLKKLGALERALMAENNNINKLDPKASKSFLKILPDEQTVHLNVSPALLTNPDMLRRTLGQTTQSQDLKNQVKESMQRDVNKSRSSLIFSQTMLGVSVAALACAGAVLAAPFVLPITGIAVVVAAAVAGVAAAGIAVTGAAFSVSNKSVKHQTLLKEQAKGKEIVTAASQQSLNTSKIELAYDEIQKKEIEAKRQLAEEMKLPDQKAKTASSKKSMAEQVRVAQGKNSRSLNL